MMSKYLSHWFSAWLPEIVLSVKDYSWRSFLCDARAGLLVSVVSFPLFMTYAIASGVAPNIGITTCVIAGALACLFGGARFQIVGPTSALAMIVFDIIRIHGFKGMTCALVMAGIMIIILGIAKIGDLIHYIPYPVTAGFTGGIGLSVIASQLSSFLGLHLSKTPTNFIERLLYCFINIETINVFSCILAIFSLIFLVTMEKYKPNLPRYFFVLVIAIFYSLIFNQNGMETIGSKFGDISDNEFFKLSIHYEILSFNNLKHLFPSAFTIAFLVSIQSLLGAVISDNLSGQKHRSNVELIGQGIANLGSAFFGGIPATCALGTTSLNVKVGAKTPIAGLFNVLFVTLFILCFGRFVQIIPLSSLAAMLIYTAWNMAALNKNKYILLSPKSDSFVFISTILITLLVDIVVAVEIGLIFSGFLFIRRSVETTTTETFSKIIKNNQNNTECEGVRICGHLFFGAAPALHKALKDLPKIHDIVYIDMQNVPFIDVTGAKVLKEFVEEVKYRNIEVIICGLNKRTMKALKKMGFSLELSAHLSEEKI